MIGAVLRRRMGQLLLALTMFCLLFPVYWLVQSSISTQRELFHTPSYIFPPNPSLVGFKEAIPAIAASVRQLGDHSVRHCGGYVVRGGDDRLWLNPLAARRGRVPGAVPRAHGVGVPSDHVRDPVVRVVRPFPPPQLVRGPDPS